MPRTVFEILAPSYFNDQLPIVIRQKTSLAAALSMLLLLVPALAAVIVPLGLIVAHASQEPAIISVVWANPLIAMQVFSGLAIWAVLFVLPLKSLLSRFGRRRTVRIEADQVHVNEQYLFYANNWSRPLASFRGIAHDVRATMSGTRHELLLVHADKQYTLLLCADDQISQPAIDHVVNLLKLPQLPTRDLYYSFSWRTGKRSAGNAEKRQAASSMDQSAVSALPAG